MSAAEDAERGRRWGGWVGRHQVWERIDADDPIGDENIDWQ
jgi:hypothetical protein